MRDLWDCKLEISLSHEMKRILIQLIGYKATIANLTEFE